LTSPPTRAQYADIRVVHNRTQTLEVKDGVVQALNFSESIGFGVRVLAGGAWGFASSRELSSAKWSVSLRSVKHRPRLALVSRETVDLGPAVTSQAYTRRRSRSTPSAFPWKTTGPADERDREMGSVAGVRTRRGNLNAIREQKWFANTEAPSPSRPSTRPVGASRLPQWRRRGAGALLPTSNGRQQQTAGWEAAMAWDLPGNAQRVASEAVALLTADPARLA